MANRTFLIESGGKQPAQRKGEPEVALAVGDNCIPIYWYSIFDETCIVANEVLVHDGRIEQYPYLVTSVKDAQKRLSIRRSLLDCLFPQNCEVVSEKWAHFVDSIALPFVHLDAAELWMMLGDDFQTHLKNSLRAYELSTPSEIRQNDFWLEMLDFAQIDPINLQDTVTPFKLAGYGWGGKAVPWG